MERNCVEGEGMGLHSAPTLTLQRGRISRSPAQPLSLHLPQPPH